MVARGHVSTEDAQADAATWLNSHDVPIDGMIATTELVDHGDTVAYSVHFERIVDGVVLADSRTVYVNAASGEIFMLADYRHPFGTAPTDGTQRLVWLVAIGAELDDSATDTPVVAHYLVEVDAIDGTARITAQG